MLDLNIEEEEVDFLSLSPAQFESMTFDVVSALGLRNAIWRTPGSDSGRDIEGNYFISDLSGQYQCQKWYVECKRYSKSVDWPTVWEKISYAQTHSADILLFVTSTSLSPQAVDQVKIWNEGGKRPIIRFWGKTELSARLNLHPQLAKKYGLKLLETSNPDIFYSSMLLLVKISDSMSPETSPISGDKLRFSHALSELILARMSDIKFSDRFDFKPHGPDDYFDSISYPACGGKKFDKYSVRALLAYLAFTLKESLNITSDADSDLVVNLPRELIASEDEHIQVITALSNFTTLLEKKKITLSLIGKGE